MKKKALFFRFSLKNDQNLTKKSFFNPEPERGNRFFN